MLRLNLLLLLIAVRLRAVDRRRQPPRAQAVHRTRARAEAHARARCRMGAAAAGAEHLGRAMRASRESPATSSACGRRRRRTWLPSRRRPDEVRQQPHRCPIACRRWRSRLVLFALLAGFVALIGRSLYLQGFNNDFLQQKGESRYERVIDISATRGRILDRHGDVLAVSTPVKSIWAIPEDARLAPAQARELAALLEMDVRELNRKLASDKRLRLSSSARFRPTSPTGRRPAACPASTSRTNTAATTRPARSWRTCWASPASRTTARKASSWR